jgi:DNA topoisomerase-1
LTDTDNRPDGLIWVTDDEPGITRKRWGKGFIYLDVRKEKINKKRIINRIKKLVIPPAWHRVWICPSGKGYLQCTGYDLQNRKQYIYHRDYIAFRQEAKFSRLWDFGQVLPLIRRTYKNQLYKRSWTKQKVLALILYLLDNYYFRVGNTYYARENQSYGLTTLRRKHLLKEADQLILSYKAKSGKDRKVKVDNRKIAKLIREISDLPGYEIFRYRDSQGKWRNVDSADVNKYLQKIGSENYTAKAFRTWGANKLLLESYPEACKMLKRNPRLKIETTLVRLVAKKMGNTISVSKQYYIHPEILSVITEHYPQPLDNLSAGQIEEKENLDKTESLLLSLLKNIALKYEEGAS